MKHALQPKKSLPIALHGLGTGLLLQLALGPVFFYIMNLVLEHSLLHGLAAILAVTLVDFIFILCALLGAAALFERKKVKTAIGCIGAIILLGFGGLMIYNNLHVGNLSTSASIPTVHLFSSIKGPISGFLGAVVLTATNPLTILFWTGIFVSKTQELHLSRNQRPLFGIATGSATIIFLTSAAVIISFFRTIIPNIVVDIANICVGVILVLYGIIRLRQNLWPSTPNKTEVMNGQENP